ncbi:MAG: TRAP transporter small permease [Truepera sp.]|jgi:TRAP-type C4-dicarboxylate transport system permease small subunit|nr:TRAP transporter small permease [Truepera sp.]
MQKPRKNPRQRAVQVFEALAGVLFAAILVLAIGQVFTRYVLNNPTSWTEEVARLLLVWATFIAIGAAALKEEFMAVDIVLERLPFRMHAAAKVVINALLAAVGIVLVVYGWKLFQFTAGDTSTSLGYPRNLIYLPVPVGGLLLTVFSLLNAVTHARTALQPRPRE